MARQLTWGHEDQAPLTDESSGLALVDGGLAHTIARYRCPGVVLGP